MSESLKAIAARYASALKVAEVFTSGEDRPTINDIWFYQLEDAVWSNVKFPKRSMHYPDDQYDPFKLYQHRACLKSREDVGNAPDDVLLEALGLGTVKEWGWLKFMVRDFAWFALLAENWGWPAMCTDYSGTTKATESANEDERRAQAAFYFVDLMRERGIDVLANVSAAGQAHKEKNNLSEEEFIERLRGHDEWIYFVYTCESVIVRPEAKGAYGEVGYTGEHRQRFRSEIRAAAESRRQNWNAPRSCDCEASSDKQ